MTENIPYMYKVLFYINKVVTYILCGSSTNGQTPVPQLVRKLY
jgi:hypothetical protein